MTQYMTENRLNALKMRLHSGEFDGVHIKATQNAIDDLIATRKQVRELTKLLKDATERLSMPLTQIRGDGFRELMGRLRGA